MGTMHVVHNEVAMEVGVTAAMILEDIGYWVKHNEENQKHIYDGHVWTYNSIAAFAKQYPFWNEKTIKRTLRELETKGYILTGNYNKMKYDRTKWYTLTEKAIKLLGMVISNQAIAETSDKDKMSSCIGTKCPNGLGQNDPIERDKKYPIDGDKMSQPIPENTENNKDIHNGVREDVKEIIDYLNEVSGKKYKATSKDTVAHIKARLRDGFTIDDFKSVIDKKCAEWGNDEKMEKFLRPVTLFGTKFESYLNQGTSSKKPQGDVMPEFGTQAWIEWRIRQDERELST